MRVGVGTFSPAKPWPQPPPCHFLTQRRARCLPATSPAGLTPSEEPPFALASHLMSLPRVSRQTSGLRALQKVAAGVLRSDRYLQLQVPPALLCSACCQGRGHTRRVRAAPLVWSVETALGPSSLYVEQSCVLVLPRFAASSLGSRHFIFL